MNKSKNILKVEDKLVHDKSSSAKRWRDPKKFDVIELRIIDS